MTRVRGQVRGGVVLGLEDNWSRMMRLGRSEIIGRYRTIDESLAEFDAVQAGDVRALAASLIAQSWIAGPSSCPRSRKRGE